MIKRVWGLLFLAVLFSMSGCSRDIQTKEPPHDERASMDAGEELGLLCGVNPEVVVAKDAEELLLQFPSKTDILGNTEVLKAALENEKSDLASYEIHGFRYTRYYDNRGIAFTGTEDVSIIYHDPLYCDGTCVERINDYSYISDGPISVDILYNPDGYLPATFRLQDDNLVDGIRNLYSNQAGAKTYYYFFPEPAYCYRFSVADRCTDFDAVVNQLIAYCEETIAGTNSYYAVTGQQGAP